MAYKVLSVGFSVLLLTGCVSFSEKNQEPQNVPPVTDQCPVLEPVVCPPLPMPEERPNRPKPVPYTPPVKELSCPKPEYNSKYQRLGQIEYVDVMPYKFRQKARIDTGAETSSIDAQDIVDFERDGKPWVKFVVKDRTTGEAVEMRAPVLRTVLVKQRGVDNVRRPVISLTLAIGSMKDDVEVTLADREEFEYPILIGRNFLQGRALVDVSRKFLSLE